MVVYTIAAEASACTYKYRYYVVKEGDSVIDVARKQHVSIKTLTKLNKINFFKNKLVIGQKLKVSRTRVVIPLGTKVVTQAKEFLGIRYVFGGESPKHGIDCSRFVQLAVQSILPELPRVSYDQYKYLKKHGKRIPLSKAKKGDIIFFSRRGHYVGHVGIIVDPKKKLMQHSSSSRKLGHKNTVSSYATRSYRRRFRGVYRLNKKS
jgi:cell wall-associated NlpC family hydrolase